VSFGATYYSTWILIVYRVFVGVLSEMKQRQLTFLTIPIPGSLAMHYILYVGVQLL